MPQAGFPPHRSTVWGDYLHRLRSAPQSTIVGRHQCPPPAPQTRASWLRSWFAPPPPPRPPPPALCASLQKHGAKSRAKPSKGSTNIRLYFEGRLPQAGFPPHRSTVWGDYLHRLRSAPQSTIVGRHQCPPPAPQTRASWLRSWFAPPPPPRPPPPALMRVELHGKQRIRILLATGLRSAAARVFSRR